MATKKGKTPAVPVAGQAFLIGVQRNDAFPAKPAGYESDLANFGVVLRDPSCGEPIAWGFKIQQRLGDDRFKALGRHGELACLDGMSMVTTWALVTRRLTFDEAVALYGPVTSEELGPRGGFRSITFGTTKFVSRELRKPRE